MPVDADSTAEQWLAHPVLGDRLRAALAGSGHGAMLDHPETGQMCARSRCDVSPASRGRR